MKKHLVTLLVCLSLGILPLTACHSTKETPQPTPTEPTKPAAPESLKVLFIGNSFSMDTVEYLGQIAKGCGVQEVLIGNLYQGGCSIQKHLSQARSMMFAYDYSTTDGTEWQSRGRNCIKTALQSEEWDWVVIQHGTLDGSRYAEEASYEKLPELIQYVKTHVGADTRVAFNMTWVGEPNSHEELIAFGNDQQRYYKAIAQVMQNIVAPTEGLDLVSPTGTAINNARTTTVRPLFRDGYHLSPDHGRYIAGLTFFAAITGTDIADVTFAPDGMSAYAKAAAIESAENAVAHPYEQTASALHEADYES